MTTRIRHLDAGRLGPTLAALLCASLAGCAAPGPARSAPGAPLSKPGAAPADLDPRALHTFNETELDAYLRELPAREPRLAARVIHLARKSLGQPYEIFLLGEFPFEEHDPDPIYCLSRSDCLTFCEHMYAMALAHDFWSFLRTLQRLRYEHGQIGMITRNHYTVAEWDRHNAFLFEDLTKKLGGGGLTTPLTHTLRRARFFKQFGIGQDIPEAPLTDAYIPAANVPRVLNELRDADFVNIIRGDAQNQWCGHTGLIAIGADGAVNFLHSARPQAREEPLLGYLERDKSLGIKILRLRPGAEREFDDRPRFATNATEVSEASLRDALARSRLTSEAIPSAHGDWAHAMKLQSYRLDYDTPLDGALQRELERSDQRVCRALDISGEQRAFGVLDLTDLRLALIRPDEMFYGASVPKVCIALAYFETHPEAADNLDPQVERELQLVIKRSDNELAAKYSQLVGLDKIQEVLQSKKYGFYDAQRGGGFWCGKHYGLDQPRLGDPAHDHSHGATVRQCLRYYLLLEQGRLVSVAASAKLKELFAAPGLEFHNENFVKGLNGRGVNMLRKSGTWEDWHLDTARVRHGERVYLLAGMTHHPKGQEYLAQMAAAVDEALCGAPTAPEPYAHELVLHESADLRSLDVDGGGAGVTYTSPAIEPSVKFNEALLSWNVNTPAGGGFGAELRVGRRFDDSWSPWLRVGEWGQAPPAADAVVACEQGRIDVDYFRSDERYDRIQYRLIGSAGIEPQRIAVCVSDTSGVPLALDRGLKKVWDRPMAGPYQALAEVNPARPHLLAEDEVDRRRPRLQPNEMDRRRPRLLSSNPKGESTSTSDRPLPVPFRSQKSEDPDIAGRICSPTSLAMVMEYRGVARSTAEVAAACYDPTHAIYGNWPRNVQAAYSFGIPGYLTRFSDWGDVERMIAGGQPLIISIRVKSEGDLPGAPYRTTEGHLLVLTGFEGEDGVRVNDPAALKREQGQLTYRRAELEQVWMRGAGGVAYVLLPTASAKAD